MLEIKDVSKNKFVDILLKYNIKRKNVMKNIYVKGYINYGNDSYTFGYEEKKLTLINVENKQTFLSQYKYVEFFKGFALDRFDIIFYINNNIYYKNGCFICSSQLKIKNM